MRTLQEKSFVMHTMHSSRLSSSFLRAVGKRFLRWGDRSIWFSPAEIILKAQRRTYASKIKTAITGWLEPGQGLFRFAQERSQGPIKLRGSVPLRLGTLNLELLYTPSPV